MESNDNDLGSKIIDITIEKMEILETIQETYKIMLFHYEIYKDINEEQDIELIGIEALNDNVTPETNTITLNNVKYGKEMNIDDIIKNKYYNILMKLDEPGIGYYNSSNDPPYIKINNSVNDDINKALIIKKKEIYKTKICSFIEIIKKTNENIKYRDCNEEKNIIESFIQLINDTMNIPFIYKLNTLDDDSYNKLFKNINDNDQDIQIFENCFIEKKNSQTCKISEENILRAFKTYYKKIIKFNPDVFVKWIKNLIIRKNIQSNDSTESDVIEFRNITQTYLKSGEINILNVVYFLDYLINFIKELLKSKKLGSDSLNIIILGIINYIIDPYLTNNIGLFYYIYEKFFENLNEKNAQSFIDFDKKFNEILEEKVNNSIITYLKIRNDNHTSKTFNKGRFPSISHDQQLTRLLVEYNSDDKTYDDNVPKIPDSDKKKYLFGEFTKIFLPKTTNKEIALDMQNIINKLVEGKPLFMLGYGASGAGKTSSLIYFKNATVVEQKPGVIIHLCNLMAGTSYGYTNIELQYSEFYYKTDGEGYKEVEIKNDNQDSGVYPIIFEYKNNGFLSKSDYTHNIIHDYRFENMTEEFTKGIEGSFGNKTKVFKKDTPLGEIIINLVDTDRFVKATTNNPNSSRSHTLVFLKLKNSSNKEANIIVGDFAGVENDFECTNPDVLNKFLNRKREDKDSNKNNTLFYSHNALVKEFVVPDQSDQNTKGQPNEKHGILDPIDNTDKFGAEKMILIESIDGKVESVYDFDEIDDKDPRNTEFINKNNTIDIKFMQKYVPFVRKYVGALVSRDSNNYESKQWIEKGQKSDIGIKKINDAYNKDKEQQIIESITKLQEVFELVDKTDYLKINIIKYDPNSKMTLESQVRELNNKLQDLREKKQEIEKNIDNKADIPKINKYKEIITEILKKQSSTNNKKHPDSDIRVYKKREQDNFMTVTDNLNNQNNQLLDSGQKIEFTGTDFISRFSNYIININNRDYVYLLKEIFSLDKDKQYNLTQIIKDKYYKNNEFDTEGFLKSFDNLIAKRKKELINDTSLSESNINNIKNNIEKIEDQLEQFKNIDKLENYLKNEINYFNNTINNQLIDENAKKYIDKIKVLIGLDKKPDILKWLGIAQYTTLKDISNKLNKYNLSNATLIIPNLLEFLKTMELENFNRQQGIKEICENRLIEGKFINTSLFEVRNTIKTILYEKNNGENISPKFIDECFDQYCPNHEYCFSSKEEEDARIKSESKPESKPESKSESKSESKVVVETNPKTDKSLTDIFGKIYDVLYTGKNKPINEMYKEIIVSVFCVFNISKEANNPPSVPYIDINDLKYIYNFKINDTTNLIKYLQQAVDDITKKYKSKVKDLLLVEITNYNNVNPTIQKIKIIVNAIKYIIENQNQNQKEYFSGGMFFDNMKIVVKEFIDMIDKSNAISAIGTLEFLDQLAKFNKVSNICRADFNLEGATPINISNMTELYK